MKQRITAKQLSELTAEQKIKLHCLWVINEFDVVKDERSELEGSVITIDDEIYVLPSNNKNGVKVDKDHCLPLLSIGQMIELINKQSSFKFGKLEDIAYDHLYFHGIGSSYYLDLVDSSELRKIQFREFSSEICDLLWQAVKKIL